MVLQGWQLAGALHSVTRALPLHRPNAPSPSPATCPPSTFTQVVDVGCGIGGSSRHLARKFGCSARGITLSPVQAARANAITAAAGLADRVSFQVGGELCCG